MSLPQQQPLALMQTSWAAQLDPLLVCPLTKGQLLQGIELSIGANSVNHKLGRKLIGWFVVGIDGVAAIYDTQASNQMPQFTLQLVSDAEVTVNLWVF